MQAVTPTTIEGIEKYLSSGLIKGIGPHLAKRLVEAFGTRVFDVIEREPERLRTVGGIGPNPRGAHQGRVARPEERARHHGLPALARRRIVARRADLQDLRPRRDRPHHREPVSPGRRHPRHRVPDRRPDRREPRDRPPGDDPGARRHRLRADRGDGRRALRPPARRVGGDRLAAARDPRPARRAGDRAGVAGRRDRGRRDRRDAARSSSPGSTRPSGSSHSASGRRRRGRCRGRPSTPRRRWRGSSADWG